MQITFTISEDQKQRVMDAAKALFPIPINPATGQPQFSDGAWAKEQVRQMIIGMVHTYEFHQATNMVVRDDSIVT